MRRWTSSGAVERTKTRIERTDSAIWCLKLIFRTKPSRDFGMSPPSKTRLLRANAESRRDCCPGVTIASMAGGPLRFCNHLLRFTRGAATLAKVDLGCGARVAAVVPSVRQRDELALAGNVGETTCAPIGLRLFDALLGPGHEIPPDIARAFHRLATENDDAGAAYGRYGHLLAGIAGSAAALHRKRRRRSRSPPSRRRPRAPHALPGSAASRPAPA